jgi:hypothetical protein
MKARALLSPPYAFSPDGALFLESTRCVCDEEGVFVSDPAGECCDDAPGTGEDVPDDADSFFLSLESLFLES